MQLKLINILLSIISRHCQVMVDGYLTVIKRILLIGFFIFSAYVLLTDYGYYHHSVHDIGIVSAVSYVSTTERKMSGDCFSPRNTCTGLYSYDTTWWQGGKSYVLHSARELKPPSNVMCVQFVQNDPHIAKLCHHLFFNVSLIPYLIGIGSIIVFIKLTLFFYCNRYSSLPVRETYRILNRHRQLLLETQEREEMQRFIDSCYRICHTTCEQEVIREGRKKFVNHYTVYIVRVRNSTTRR